MPRKDPFESFFDALFDFMSPDEDEESMWDEDSDSEGFFDVLFDFMSPDEGEEPMWDQDSYRLNRDQRRYIADRDDWECVYCDDELDSRNLEIDHDIPWSRGGSSHRDNLHASCRSCNQEKYDMTGDEYEEYLDEDNHGQRRLL